MDEAQRIARVARQALAIDQAFGVESVVVRRLPELEAESGNEPRRPARPRPDAGRPPVGARSPAATAPSPRSQSASSSSRPAARNAPMPPRASQAAENLPDVPQIAIDDVQGRDLTAEQKQELLEALRQQITDYIEAGWPRDGWNRVVFGEGDPDAKIMFVGEGPGADEDRLGRPFVGRAGKLLDKQIKAMGLEREQVYIANIARTRPPGNRVPSPAEAACMMPFLVRQLNIIKPQAIVALGATSAKHLLGDPKLMITKERGVWRKAHGFDVLPTFHPSYLLRSYTTENRRRVWDDLKKVMEKVGIG